MVGGNSTYCVVPLKLKASSTIPQTGCGGVFLGYQVPRFPIARSDEDPVPGCSSNGYQATIVLLGGGAQVVDVGPVVYESLFIAKPSIMKSTNAMFGPEVSEIPRSEEK